MKTLIKLTTTVALTFGFVSANAAYPVGDVMGSNISVSQAIGCYKDSKISPKTSDVDFLKCIKLNTIVNTPLDHNVKKQSLVDSIKQAQTTGSSFTSKQYDDYARMANVMTFANANSDANLDFKKQLARSAQDYIFKVTLDAQNKVAYEALRDTQNQATNQAILTTLLAMSDSLNQIKNDLNNDGCVTGNCTVKASTEKEVSNNLTSDQLNAFAKGVLDEQAKQKHAVELPIFEGTQLTTK